MSARPRLSWIAYLFTLNLLFSLGVAAGQVAAGAAGYRLAAFPRPVIWGTPTPVSNSTSDSLSPGIVVAPSGAIHVVWEENGRVYHAVGQGGRWSSPLIVAWGDSPAIVADARGVIHLVWSADDGTGNLEIYYARYSDGDWGLPRNVSNTSGTSATPAITVAPAGQSELVVVAWADMTPGRPVIYYGTSTDGAFWTTAPVPNADGIAPALVFDPAGVLHLAWQDRDPVSRYYEVWHSQWNGKSWTLPVAVSYTSEDAHSTAVTIASTADSDIHLVWQENVAGNNNEVYYSRGREYSWSSPINLSQSATPSYLPVIAADEQSYLYVVWTEGGDLPGIEYVTGDALSRLWLEPAPVVNNPDGIGGPSLALDPVGSPSLAWAGVNGSLAYDVSVSRGTLQPLFRLFLPAVWNSFNGNW